MDEQLGTINKKNLKMKKKVGIITWHYYPDFESVLQAYALQRTII